MKEKNSTREKLFRILLTEYGRIVNRELGKKEETLNQILAEGISYREFLNNEIQNIHDAIGEIHPGDSLIERIYNKRVNDGKFDDYTSKNLLLSIRNRFELVLYPDKTEHFEKALSHIQKIPWYDHEFTIRENYFKEEFVSVIENDPDKNFIENALIILERQSFEFVSKINEITIKRLSESLEEEKRLRTEISRELQMAQKIQLSLLPQSFPARIGLEIYSKYLPVASVGGDFFDFGIMPERNGKPSNKIGFIIADVSGHGVPAAFIALMAKIAWQHGLDHYENPSEILRYLNSQLLEKTAGNFITAFLGVFDSRDNSLHFSNGGHIPSVLLRGDENPVLLEGRGKILGLFPEVSLDEKKISMNSGDRFIFYTDGLLEARNPDKELLGQDRMLDIFYSGKKLKGNDFCDHVIRSVQKFSGTKTPEDDMTLVVVDSA